MKSKLLAVFAIVLFSGIFSACSEENIEPMTDRKDMAKGSSKQEDKW